MIHKYLSSLIYVFLILNFLLKDSNVEILSKNRRQLNSTLDSSFVDHNSAFNSFFNFDLNHSNHIENKTLNTTKSSNFNTLINKRNKSEHQSLDGFEHINRNSSNSCSNLHRKASFMSNVHLSPRGERCSAEGSRRRNTLFKNPVVKMLKNLTVCN